MEKYDLAVIGAGPGGYPAAIRATQLGLKAAIIEKDLLGGTCLNWGCIPTKALIHCASEFWRLQHEPPAGVKADTTSADFPAMMEHKNRVVSKLRDGIAQLLKANDVAVIEGAASFTGRNRISVSSINGSTELEAANIIIATGCVSSAPAALPKSQRILDSRAFLDLAALPDSLIVMGGGIIGCEFACMAAQLGVRVTIVELLPDIMPFLDKDVRTELRRHMERTLNIKIITGLPLEKLSAGSAGVEGKAGAERIEAELLLNATGRRPNTRELTIEAAGVRVKSSGFIEVDASNRTSAASVYAIGDVTGGQQLAHFATAQGVAVAERLAGQTRRGGWLVPACVFTAPEIGYVGLTEEEAKAQDKQIQIGKFPFAASGKAMASEEANGFVKWVADPSSGQLLGAQVVGPRATELIAEATLAVQLEMTAAELAKTIHSHPTLSEAWQEAANAVQGHCIHLPPQRKKARGVHS